MNRNRTLQAKCNDGCASRKEVTGFVSKEVSKIPIVMVSNTDKYYDYIMRFTCCASYIYTYNFNIKLFILITEQLRCRLLLINDFHLSTLHIAHCGGFLNQKPWLMVDVDKSDDLSGT